MNHITLTGTVATEPRRRRGLDQPAVAFRLAVPRDDGSEPLHVDVILHAAPGRVRRRPPAW